MQSRQNMIIGILSVLLILSWIFGFIWSRSNSEQQANDQLQLAEQAQAIEQLETTIQELQNTLTEKEEELRKKDAEVERRKEIQAALNDEIQKEMKDGEIEIRQTPKTTTIHLKEQILFPTGKAELKASGIEILKKVAKALRNVKEHEIQVEGHTDNLLIGPLLRNTYATNWELSTARSTRVVRYLVEELGVDANRISAAGFGRFNPIVPNDTPANRQLNRRVEFVLRPIEAE